MKSPISKNVVWLSLGFMFIFFGFNGIQQYVTVYFSEAGLVSVGFRSLTIIYLLFILFNLLTAAIISKLGAKKSMVFTAIFYTLFILSLLTKSTALIYIAACLLGIGSSLLWTSQNSYLLRASEEKTYGSHAGFFNTLFSLGSATGILLLGLLVSKSSFTIPFVIFSIAPVIGLAFLLKIVDIKMEKQSNQLKQLKKSISSPTVLKLSTIWFSFNFVYGLVIGLIPIEIKNQIGISWVGILSSLFYFMPIFFSYILGRLSDIHGRKNALIYSYIISIIGLAVLYIFSGAFLLIIGIILLAFNFAITRTITFALVGDLASENNLESLTALFWMAQGIGIFSALIFSSIVQQKIIYLVSIAITLISLALILPLLKLGFIKIREKISTEISVNQNN